MSIENDCKRNAQELAKAGFICDTEMVYERMGEEEIKEILKLGKCKSDDK